MTKYKVALAQFPGGGVSRMETNAWVVKTVRQMDRDERVSEVVSLTYADTPITMLRNRSVLDARQAGCQYLLMVDSDMRPDLPCAGSAPFWEAAWDFMVERRQQEDYRLAGMLEDCRGRLCDEDHEELRRLFPPATVAAPYCGPSPDQCVYVMEWKSRGSDHPNPDFQLGMIPRESAAIRSGIHEVAALPTGLILYDMRVFDVLPPSWFEYEFGDEPYRSQKVTTEDIYQTRNASMLGLPQYCAFSSWAGHVKTQTVPKPGIVTRDQVHKSLVEAVLRGIDSDDRLVILDGSGHHDQEDVQQVQGGETEF